MCFSVLSPLLHPLICLIFTNSIQLEISSVDVLQITSEDHVEHYKGLVTLNKVTTEALYAQQCSPFICHFILCYLLLIFQLSPEEDLQMIHLVNIQVIMKRSHQKNYCTIVKSLLLFFFSMVDFYIQIQLQKWNFSAKKVCGQFQFLSAFYFCCSMLMSIRVDLTISLLIFVILID